MLSIKTSNEHRKQGFLNRPNLLILFEVKEKCAQNIGGRPEENTTRKS
jgi:hypothetical protein